MQFLQLFTHVGSSSHRACAYRLLNSSQEGLLANTHTRPVDSELPSYESLLSPPGCRATAPQSSASIASLGRRLAHIFTRRSRDKKQAPVSPEHLVTLGQIERAEDEIYLGHELQAAIERERRLESTWDVAQQIHTPSDLNGEFDERMNLAEHTEALYNRLAAIIGADIGPQMCLPGAPRAELVGQQLADLRELESLQRKLADCTAKIGQCEWAIICPRYSGMSAASAMRRIGELMSWRGTITSQIAAVKEKISWVDLLMKEMLREYDAMGA
ncbi:hypothetical protein F4782DRAFT_533939 [Xylaria castorea]|nr:hypothetical protein F4782DRAFT_533939 [Xylaria castorea]